ncbi:helix-turn-helix domain-containing protein [Ralstonia pseudosolanacearum]|uniref:helix-turn-helix domain-containing protein n=1 Tax=Ralstonia pseudosolanacearum TaxID=1310165 RepID=UPI001FFB6FD6|nr:helix-turn-helix domain-containing protein [Ralstonia pseudosolanacearum]
MTTITPDRINLTDDQAALLADASRLMGEALDRPHAARVALVEEGDGRDLARIEVPPATLRVLSRLLAMMASEQTFLLYPAHTELTTKQAADLLGVSRPYLIARLEAGELEYRKVGRHRRIRMDDVLAYKDTMRQTRKAALNELVEQSEALGGYDL